MEVLKFFFGAIVANVTHLARPQREVAFQGQCKDSWYPRKIFAHPPRRLHAGVLVVVLAPNSPIGASPPASRGGFGVSHVACPNDVVAMKVLLESSSVGSQSYYLRWSCFVRSPDKPL